MSFNYSNAAVLPTQNVNGQVYYQFGLEMIHGQPRLSTFGGKKEDKIDRGHPTWTASRECAEESLQIWGDKFQITPLINQVGQKILNPAHHNVTFIVPMPNIGNAPAIFEHTRQQKISANKLSHSEKEVKKIISVTRQTLLHELSKQDGSYPTLNGYKVRGSVLSTLRIAYQNNLL